MGISLILQTSLRERNSAVTETVIREGGRLRNFIRRRVADAGDAEDILQEVLYELTLAYRLPEPVEQLGAWMYRVAINRITDLFRKKKPVLLGDVLADEDDELAVEDLLPPADGEPESAYMRSLLLEEIAAALDELTPEQRDVFIAHELEGRSFKELAAERGVGINTLTSRKRYAVLRLRKRLRAAYDDFLDT